MRVEHPLELAERVLADPVRWNSGAIQKVIEAGETKNVSLPKPLLVLLLYWTVSIDGQGSFGSRTTSTRGMLRCCGR